MRGLDPRIRLGAQRHPKRDHRVKPGDDKENKEKESFP
jgi:hypothetical protein